MGGGASVDAPPVDVRNLNTGELAQVAEAKDYKAVGAIIRENEINSRTALELDDDDLDDLAPNKLTRKKLTAAMGQFKEAIRACDSASEFIAGDDEAREEKPAAAPAAPAPPAAPPPSTEIDPAAVRRFVAATEGVSPWSLMRLEEFTAWWEASVVGPLGDFAKKDQRPILREFARSSQPAARPHRVL